MKKIYVLGSINIDLVIHTPYIPKNGETLAGSDFLINEGGKGANQAVAASKQEIDTYLIGCLGDDVFSDKILSTLKNYHVKTDYIQKLEKTNTGTAIIIIENGDNRIILDKGANQYVDVKLIDKALSQAQNKDIFISQLEINLDAVIYGLKKAKSKNMITIFNPAPAKILDSDIYQYIDYLILNESECEILTNICPKYEEDYQKIYDFFMDKGLKNLIITLGKKGAVYLNNQGLIKVKANKVDAIDTTAAGDTFVGVFASCLCLGKSIKEALEYSCLCSSLTCLKMGAQQAIPTKKEVIEYINK